ncbi:AbrB family transcriptional regulator [Duganella sp. Leaf126]|uniref:antitoxin n=1 Tax=Duganella sp. Leaf126 TaxID=1736266 RepID=UPI0006F707BA|nr:type II toxin-antitoxin system VapB family antitoxin [Duganella sp. Leaf126]KQQ33278.1 AbrB family transcriptional regulator [Duganella sp. Leaf126]
MHATKAFKTGNSQAVEIPAELAYSTTDLDLEIERVGEELRIRPAQRSLAGVLRKFARFSPDFLVEGRGPQEQEDREKL